MYLLGFACGYSLLMCTKIHVLENAGTRLLLLRGQHHTYCLVDGYYHVNTGGSSNTSRNSHAEHLRTHCCLEVGTHHGGAPA